MSILLLLILIAAIATFVAGLIKKNKALIITGVILGVVFAALFYMLGQALSNM